MRLNKTAVLSVNSQVMDGTLTTRESHGTHPLHMEEGQIRDIVQEIAIEGVVIDNDHGHHGSEVSSTDTSSTSYTESDDESGDEEGWSESEDEQDVVLRTSDRTGIYGFFVRGYYRVLYGTLCDLPIPHDILTRCMCSSKYVKGLARD